MDILWVSFDLPQLVDILGGPLCDFEQNDRLATKERLLPGIDIGQVAVVRWEALSSAEVYLVTSADSRS